MSIDLGDALANYIFCYPHITIKVTSGLIMIKNNIRFIKIPILLGFLLLKTLCRETFNKTDKKLEILLLIIEICEQKKIKQKKNFFFGYE